MLARRVQRMGFSPTLGVNDLAGRLREQGIDVVDFGAGQPDFPTPLPVKQAGQRAIEQDRTRYTATAGVIELRRAIAARLARDRALEYAPDEILVSPGAKASLYFACMALIDPGDEVIVPSPYWSSYLEQVRLAGGEAVIVPCPEEAGFKLDAARLEAAVTERTKAVILNYPANPSGACFTERELLPLADVCVRRGLVVIADEIYAKLLYDGRTFTSIAALSPAVRDRTVVIDGVSKTYSMTGWRIGYAAGPREWIAGMAKLQSHSTSNATSISQWASVAALELDDAELAPRLAEFARRREAMVRALRAMPGVSCIEPEGAFYVFASVAGCFRPGGLASGEELARHLLERARVAVVPGEAFGWPSHIRLSYALPLARLEEGMQRMAQALAG